MPMTQSPDTPDPRTNGHDESDSDGQRVDESFQEYVQEELVQYDNRIEELEEKLADRNERIETLEDTVAELDARTDMLRLVEDSDQLSAHERSTALIQHLHKQARNNSGDDRTRISREQTEQALHYPDIDRTTFITDMRRCVKLVGDEDVCWYEGRDEGNTQKSFLYLDLGSGDLPNDLSTAKNGGE